MNPESQSDEAFEKMLREKLTPRSPGWENDRALLEALVLKDPVEKARQRRSRIFKYGWMASAGVIAAAFIAAFSILQVDQSTLESESERLGAPVQFGRQSVASSQSSSLELKAIGAKERLIGVEDMGWKEGEDGNVTRAYKYDYIDTVDLVNEEDGSVVRLEVPRQEIINVKYQLI
jgi:hypothetical protein